MCSDDIDAFTNWNFFSQASSEETPTALMHYLICNSWNLAVEAGKASLEISSPL
jgi:hypothetical protein